MKKPEEIKKGLECALCDKPADICGEGCPCWSAYSPAEMRQDEHVSDALAYIQKLEADNAQLHRCIENLTDKLNAANDALPRWIPVEERLPERGITKCSACVKCGDGLKRVVCASYNAELKLWTGWHGEKIGNEITHWMPLPEPPEEVRHE